MLLMYIAAVTGMELIKVDQELPVDHPYNAAASLCFRDTMDAILTLLQVFSFDSIGGIYRPLVKQNVFCFVYFVLAMLILSIALMNLVTAVMVNSSLDQASQDKEAKKAWEAARKAKQMESLKKMFLELDEDGSGELSLEELLDAPESATDQLKEIAGSSDLEELFGLLDYDGGGTVGVEEFCEGVLKASSAPPGAMELSSLVKQCAEILKNSREALAILTDEKALQELARKGGLDTPGTPNSSATGTEPASGIEVHQVDLLGTKVSKVEADIGKAGKTSTLSILTGAILPSAGKAFLGGFDVVQEQRKVRRLLGYCPQHDALLDRLTVREHLELFGRIKGIPRQDLRRVCDQMMQDLSLSPHVDKLSMTLSGGNKRKLSLAIALMGSPPLVLLDEPSTGVDPAARRLMWHVISSVSTLRKESTVILTTHNMEEAEALCSRIGIMVGGRLRCLGSNQRLKARFGQGYQLEVCLNGPEDLKGFILKHKLPAFLHEIEVKRSCAELGQPGRAALIRAGCEEGFLVFDSLSREGSVSSEVFAQWWLFEDCANNLAAFLERHFPGTLQLERHEHNFRFRLPQSCPLGEVFRVLEESRDELHLHEYGVSQASLEQIFNDFAAQQEETGPVQGLFRDGRALQDRSGSVEMMTGV
ncbi:unnamed protein product [Cladocopium goreaui]|uniref:ABC transporter A family member 1 (ABC transporter ABCA.1) (AtABCA1) (ABC one homolog protein 1) (AtAOH1) n=2 Tax=Cladocopium goreaui TaxID=2562237 RepID=A0A9P1CQX7_9DINO|nr:unnamed protein product [Cladocopium goreaui]